MTGRFRNKFALGAAALVAAALAGGAYAATQSGTNPRQAFLDDAAHRLNVTPQQLTAALKGALIDRLNRAVKDGRMTQAEADAIKQRINQGKLPLFFGRHGRGGFGPNGSGHNGFAHHGFGHGLRHGVLSAAAGYLGLTPVQLFDQLRGGKSLAQVAKDKGKTTAGLKQAMTTAFKTRLGQAVSTGRITKAQEQTILSRFQSRLDRVVNRTGPKFGPRTHAGMFEGPPPPFGRPPPPPAGP